MKITDPSLWPAHVAEVALRSIDEPGDGPAFALADADGLPRALLTPTRAADDPIEIELPDGSCVEVQAGWEVTVLPRDGAEYEDRVLFRAADDADADLTSEVQAWATLTLLWAFGAAPRGRG